MVIEEVVNASAKQIVTLAAQVGRIGLWLQAIGAVVVIWIIVQIINFLMYRKRMQEIYNIKKDMKRIEGKIDKLVKRKR